MKKNWLTATYKIREARRLEYNLQNQEFNYYLPKITIKKTNSNSKEVYLFPGYVFVNTNLENYSALKYTIGIKDIVKFGDNIPFMSDAEIKSMQLVEENSKKNPISPKIQIGKITYISKGTLKGIMVKICSLPSKERVDVLLTFLGSMRRVNVPINDLKF